MKEDRARWRSLLGRATALWAGRDGVRVEPDRWLAISGAKAVDFNVVCCHGAGSVARGRDELLAAGVPGLLMLGDVALGEAQNLVEAGWVCIDSVPSMSAPIGRGESGLTLAGPPPAGELRRVTSEDIDAVRATAASALGLPPELGAIALPDRGLTDPEMAIWGAFDAAGELVSTVATVRVEESVAVWSMATAAAARGQGHASHLLTTALAEWGEAGAGIVLLYAAPAAVDFYLDLGLREFERWQLWSRPRWVLGRA